MLWFSLQLWALGYYMRVANSFGRRVHEITLGQIKSRMLVQQAKEREAQRLREERENERANQRVARQERAAKPPVTGKVSSMMFGRGASSAAAQAQARGRRASFPARSQPTPDPEVPKPLARSKTKPALTKQKTDLRNWSHLPESRARTPNAAAEDEAGAETEQKPAARPVSHLATSPGRISRPAPTLIWPSPQRVLASAPPAPGVGPARTVQWSLQATRQSAESSDAEASSKAALPPTNASSTSSCGPAPEGT